MRFEGSAFSVRHTQYSLKSDYGSSIDILFIQTEIAREQKICRKILRAGTWAGVILAFVRIMKPWISADFEQGEVRAGKFLWFFRRTKPPLLIWQKRKNTLANYSPSIRSRCALPPTPEQHGKCWNSSLSLQCHYHIRGGGLPVLPDFWSMCSGLGEFWFYVPKTSPRKSWSPNPGLGKCHKSPTGQRTPLGALLWSGLSWRNNYVQVDQILP